METAEIRPTLTATPSEPMPVNEPNNVRIDAKCECGADVFAWKASAAVNMFEQPTYVLLTGSNPGKLTITAADSKKHEADIVVEFFGVPE
jgi:hypothetical protein